MENAIMVALRAYESGMSDEIGRRLAESLPTTSGTAL
jgi:glycerol-3-phosphate acyltransferase PlsX